MTTLIEQIEEMRIRMNQLAAAEQDLVRALGDALSHADQKLLQDVRGVAEEHEVRRGAILKELQGLAARMGALPRPRRPFAALEEVPVDLAAERAAAAAGPAWRRLAPGGRQYPGGAGLALQWPRSHGLKAGRSHEPTEPERHRASSRRTMAAPATMARILP